MDNISVFETDDSGSIPDRPTKHRRSEMKYRLEIRPAEGGEDSKLFTKDLAQAYVKYFNRVG